MTMSLLAFPPELLEYIVREIGPREDLLSLAQTCSRLRDIVVSGHLDYRDLCVSTHHTSLWDHLLFRPDLAANVRSLTLYVGHPEAFMPMFRDEARVTWHAPAGLIDFPSCTRTPTDTLADAFRLLQHAHTFELHVSWVPDDDEPADVEAFHSALGVLDAACTNLPTLDKLTVCAPGIYEQEPEKESRSAVWNMHELKKIDFRAFGQCVFTHPGLTRFCDMLSVSSMLEELHISMEARVFETLAANPLPRLKHFFVYNVGLVRPGDEAVAMSFLEQHPGLETLQLPRLFKDWQSSFTKPILPNIKAFIELPQVFLRCVLGGREPQSLRVHTLGDFALTDGSLDLLQVIMPMDLRRVRLAKLDSIDTLRRFAHMFPAIDDLTLPPAGATTGIVRPPFTVRTRSRMRALKLSLRGGHVCLVPHWAALRLSDVAPLFPCLNTVSYVQTPPKMFVPFRNDTPGWGPVYFDPRGKDLHSVCVALAKLSKRYPNLKEVNGWRLTI